MVYFCCSEHLSCLPGSILYKSVLSLPHSLSLPPSLPPSPLSVALSVLGTVETLHPTKLLITDSHLVVMRPRQILTWVPSPCVCFFCCVLIVGLCSTASINQPTVSCFSLISNYIIITSLSYPLIGQSITHCNLSAGGVVAKHADCVCSNVGTMVQ